MSARMHIALRLQHGWSTVCFTARVSENRVILSRKSSQLQCSRRTHKIFQTNAAATLAAEPVNPNTQVGASVEYIYSCPICHDTKFTVRQQGDRPVGHLHCDRCARTFSLTEKYADLTITSGVPQKVYKQANWAGTEIFRSPLISFIYEKGWRQNFATAGFPGPDQEFALAMDYLRPAYGEILLDMSCGSGLFSRRFAKSGKFAGVIAADFSDAMLSEAASSFTKDGTLDRSGLTLLRADVGRLPFPTGSLSAIHAGAAIHCWPNATAAMAEISRVLKPGGIFVASTFLDTFAPLGEVVGDATVRPLKRVGATSAYRWWEEDELRDLAVSVGLQSFRRIRKFRFILFSVTKPVMEDT